MTSDMLIHVFQQINLAIGVKFLLYVWDFSLIYLKYTVLYFGGIPILILTTQLKRIPVKAHIYAVLKTISHLCTISKFTNRACFRLPFLARWFDVGKLSRPEFYGDVIYKLRKINGHTRVLTLFKKSIRKFIKREYDPIILQRTACLVISPFTVGNNAVLFSCTPTGRDRKSVCRERV